MNIAEPLIAQARERAEVLAIIQPSHGGDRTITFGELDRRSAWLAGRLKAKGLKPGDRVLVMIGISIELYVAMCALLRSGLVATFLDPSAGREHVRLCCHAAPPTALLGPVKSQLLRLVYPGLRPASSIVYPKPFGMSMTGPAEEQPVTCSADSPALLTFTSGSTAAPKAAVRTHGLLAAQQAALAEAIKLQPGQVDLATLPIFVLANLAAGVTTVIADADLRRPGFIEPDPVLEQIARHDITRSTGSPAFYRRLVERCEQTGRTLAPLRTVYTGGAPVFPDVLARLDAQLPDGGPVTVYGSTEAEPIAHVAYDRIGGEDFAAMRQGKGLLVGRPVRQVELRIADPQRLKQGRMTPNAFEAACCGVDEPGEVLLTGEHVLKGYLDPEDDWETKLRVDDTTWHRSGDAGYLDAAGRLWLLGRVSAVIHDQRGTAYPFAVECAARQIKGVRLAAMLGINDKRVLVVQPDVDEDGSELVDAGSLVSAIETRFAGEIDDITIRDSIPLDARHNAKVRYPELHRLLNEAYGPQANPE